MKTSKCNKEYDKTDFYHQGVDWVKWIDFANSTE